MLAEDSVNLMKADALVVESPLLGVEKLIRMDIIRVLDGVHINQSSNVSFSRMEPCACAVIKIEEPDFSANEQTKVWTALWKWSGNQPPKRLTNKVPEYPMSTQVPQEYCHKLKT